MTIDLSRATPERPIRVGRYDVTNVIRSGGMGTVYDAIDREHGTRVALKTLTHLSPDWLLRFKTEFRSVAGLSHPNLVPLYELGRHEDLWFFTMERIDGVDFIEWLRGPSIRDAVTEPMTSDSDPTVRGGGAFQEPRARSLVAGKPPSLSRVREAMRQLASGVRALHAAGLLHLDIKPSNVLVDRQGRVVLLDFGLVRTIDAPEGRGVDAESIVISGTPAWMAPEQYGTGGIGEAADWYAVGLMLYAALTGVPAFAPGAVAVTWFAKLHVPPPPPHQLVPELPRDLSALAMALIEPDPADRPDPDTIAAVLEGHVGEGAVPRALVRTGLVGRASERERLVEAYEHVASGGTAVVHVIGPSGVGKSALLRSLIDHALGHPASRPARVLRGRCYERETVPYKAFDGMLDALATRLAARPQRELEPLLPTWIDALARVFPVLANVPSIAARLEASEGGVPALELRRRAGEALRELFAALAREQPLLLEIDDLQWADVDSATLLASLLEAPAPGGLLIAVSFRPEEAASSASIAPYLEALDAVRQRGDVGFTNLELGPLSADEARELARATLASHAAGSLGGAAAGVPDAQREALAAAIAKESGGVPFFVEELALFASSRGAIDATGVSLDDVLARRVALLPAAERALVEVLAVANSPIPLSVSFRVAGIDTGVLRALWSLRGGHFVRATGARPDDRVELHHDRMRESVLRSMPATRVEEHHLALGRALADRGAESPWLFDAVRHLDAVRARLDVDERFSTARLALAAAERARAAAAFPRAFELFRTGVELVGDEGWSRDYALALALGGGAAEAAYLSASWEALDDHVARVVTHGRTVLDQLVAWEVKIDAHIARNEYADAVRAGLTVLRLLGVELPAAPGENEVGVELRRAMAAFARVGREGLRARAPATDPAVVAAMRIQTRLSSAAYFAQPMLFPVIACRLVATSIEQGLSPATPYGLAIYGIVLNTLGMPREGHTCGSLAIELIERFEDRSLEARTRHVVFDLVCTWTVPLASTLDDLLRVVDVGKRIGDLEYASYAAHAYVHNALYAARELTGLREEALAFGRFMRSYRQVNALHVHAPFERLLAVLTGLSEDPSRLDGEGFREADALVAAEAAGSRSAQCIVRLLMGIVRYHFGDPAEASAHLEAARPFLDGVASTWHVPMLQQYAALAILAMPEAQQAPLRSVADTSLAALRDLAEHGAANFAHRVALIEAERARVAGDLVRSRERFDAAIEGASRGGWWNDLGLAHALAARALEAAEPGEAARHREAAREAYTRWGASALASRL